jgi:glutamate 5-kinase
MASGAGSHIGTGGMITKVLAAKRAATSGAHTIIANGRELNVLPRLANGEVIGTHLKAVGDKLSARQQWMADHLQLRGSLVLDVGACKALVQDGKSLLSIGVLRVEGEFSRGDIVACLDEAGKSLARGIVNYSASESRLIARKASSDIVTMLGYVAEPELMHRDNMVRI